MNRCRLTPRFLSHRVGYRSALLQVERLQVTFISIGVDILIHFGPKSGVWREQVMNPPFSLLERTF